MVFGQNFEAEYLELHGGIKNCTVKTQEGMSSTHAQNASNPNQPRMVIIKFTVK
jgi:hypothetical protein